MESMYALLIALAASSVHGLAAPKVTVFGGSGFLGRSICQRLVDAKCSVVSVSRSGRPADAPSWADAVDWVSADVASDADAVAQALRGSSAAVSCVGGFRDGKASPTGLGDIPILFSTANIDDEKNDRAANGPPVERIVAAAQEANVERFVLLSVSSDVENALAGGIPGYFRGKGEALQAAVDAYPDAVVVCPHLVAADGAGAPWTALLDSPIAKGIVSANAFIGNIGYRGEDLVTKVALTPPAALGDVSRIVAAAAVGDLDAVAGVSERVTRRIDPDNSDVSKEYRLQARFVDGTEGIRAAAARLA